MKKIHITESQMKKILYEQELGNTGSGTVQGGNTQGGTVQGGTGTGGNAVKKQTQITVPSDPQSVKDGVSLLRKDPVKATLTVNPNATEKTISTFDPFNTGINNGSPDALNLAKQNSNKFNFVGPVNENFVSYTKKQLQEARLRKLMSESSGITKRDFKKMR